MRKLRGAAAVLPLEEVMRADVRECFRENRQAGEISFALAAVVERALAQEGELRAVIAEFIDLRVIELDDADDLRRREKSLRPCHADAGRWSTARDGKPAGNRGWIDAVAVAG